MIGRRMGRLGVVCQLENHLNHMSEVFTGKIVFLYYDLLRLHQYSGQALRQTCSTLGSWDNIGILCQDQ